LVLTILGQKRFLAIYFKSMFVLCALNLLLYIDHAFLYSISQPISSLFKQLTTWSGNVLYENYIFLAKPVYGVTFDYTIPSFIKNPGIFGEGGYYQYFVNIALIISLFYYKKPIFSIYSIIFVLSILTTYSTVGYLILFIIILNKILNKIKLYDAIKIIPIVFICSFYFLKSPTIYNKLLNVNSTEYLVSTQRRILDTTIDLAIIQDQPLLGLGHGNSMGYKVYKNQYGGGESSSNGLLSHIAEFGIIGMFITLYPFIYFRFKSKKKYMIILCNILTAFSQGIIMTPIFLFSMSLLNEKEKIQ
jgi:hypothetical protein